MMENLFASTSKDSSKDSAGVSHARIAPEVYTDRHRKKRKTPMVVVQTTANMAKNMSQQLLKTTVTILHKTEMMHNNCLTSWIDQKYCASRFVRILHRNAQHETLLCI
jgi:hypothetical protein